MARLFPFALAICVIAAALVIWREHRSLAEHDENVEERIEGMLPAGEPTPPDWALSPHGHTVRMLLGSGVLPGQLSLGIETDEIRYALAAPDNARRQRAFDKAIAAQLRSRLLQFAERRAMDWERVQVELVPAAAMDSDQIGRVLSLLLEAGATNLVVVDGPAAEAPTAGG